MRLSSVGYSEGCWETNNKHCSRNPLHFDSELSYFSGNASRGLAVAVIGVAFVVGVTKSGLASGLGRHKLCSVLTSSSMTDVNRVAVGESQGQLLE